MGTFLDDPSVDRKDRDSRERMLNRLARECGLLRLSSRAIQSSSSLLYHEVSCAGPNLEEMDAVQEAVFRTVLSHTYMGERIPKTYLQISEKLRRELDLQSQEVGSFVAVPSATEPERLVPLMNLKVLVDLFGDEAFVKRALGLLSMWGECVYSETPPALASVVILDPRFLAKGILADFFTVNSTFKAMKKDGVVKHADLVHIWKRFRGDDMNQEGFISLCTVFIALLEKLGVCFVMAQSRELPFLEQSSIVPALLPPRREINVLDKRQLTLIAASPDNQRAIFNELWPQDAPFDRPVEVERSLLFNIIPVELVSRLLVRLHPLIQQSLVWRDEALLLQKDDNTQAWIRISLPDNSFCVSQRGNSEKTCLKMMEVITSEVTTGCQSYSGVSFTEAVRSPFSPNTLIPVEEVIRTQEGRYKLKCPETHFPLKPANLLLRSGHLHEAQEEFSSQWWEDALEALPKGKLFFQLPRSAIFLSLLNYLGGQEQDVAQVYAINNPQLRLSLKNSLRLLQGKQEDTRSLFQRADWKSESTSDLAQRRETLAYLGDLASKFYLSGWNDGSEPPIVPLVQRIPKQLAMLIALHGFGILPSSETGLFGNGLYFTDSIAHLNACKSSLPMINLQENGEDINEHVFLLSLVLPGNAYPVAEPESTRDHAPTIGIPCRPGYQSHFATNKKANGNVAGELVIFDPSQALPMFMWSENPDAVPAVPPPVTTPVPAPIPALALSKLDLQASKSRTSIDRASVEERTTSLDNTESFETVEHPRTELTISMNSSWNCRPFFLKYFAVYDTSEPSLFVLVPVPPMTIETLSLSAGEGLQKWWRPELAPTSHDQLLIPVVEDGKQRNPALYEKLASLLPLLGEKVDMIKRAYWINNPMLAAQFEVCLDCTEAKHRLNPTEFNNKGWQFAAVDPELKQHHRERGASHLQERLRDHRDPGPGMVRPRYLFHDVDVLRECVRQGGQGRNAHLHDQPGGHGEPPSSHLGAFHRRFQGPQPARLSRKAVSAWVPVPLHGRRHVWKGAQGLPIKGEARAQLLR